jgi:hypothetical protein
MKKYLILSCIILVIAISLLSTDEAKPESLKGKVTEFSATDMPFDDGAGIVLKWKAPLRQPQKRKVLLFSCSSK